MYEEHYDEDGFKLSFDEDVSKGDKRFFMRTFPNVSRIAERKVHCTSCQTHIGTAPIAEAVIRKHPVLGVTQCSDCHDFYNSGEFSKGEDGSELYCRWCGQGGEVYCCSNCPFVFCKSCIIKNLSRVCVQDIASNDNWSCFRCAPNILSHLRAQHWALSNFIQKQKKDIKKKNYNTQTIMAMMKEDKTTCCSLKGRRKQRISSIPEGSDSGKDSPKPSTSKAAAAASTKDEEESVPLSALAKLKEFRSVKVVPAHLLLSQPQVILNSVLARKEKPTPNQRKSKSPAERKKKLAANQLEGITGSKPIKQEYRAGKRQLESPEVSETDQAEERPSAKKAKHNNDEVVCTPDIIGILSPVVEITPITPILRKAQQQEKVHSSSPGTPSSATADHSIDATVPSTASNQAKTQPTTTPGSVANIRTMHDKLKQYLGVKDSPATPKPSKLPLPIQLPPSANRTPQAPVYHIINGFRVDLHKASQQSTYRLPDGKLIQVRKQKSSQPESVPNGNESDATQNPNPGARPSGRGTANGTNCSYTVTSLPSASNNAGETSEIAKDKRMFSVHQTLPKGHPQLTNNIVAQRPQPHILVTNQRMPVKHLRFQQLPRQEQQLQPQPLPALQPQSQQPIWHTQQQPSPVQQQELQRPALQFAPRELQPPALQLSELQQQQRARQAKQSKQQQPPLRPLLPARTLVPQLQPFQQPQLQQQPLQPQILLQSPFQQQVTLQQQQQQPLHQQQQPLHHLQIQNSNTPSPQQMLRFPSYLEISTFRPPFPAEQQNLQNRPFQSSIVTQQPMQPQPFRQPQPQYQSQLVVTAVRPPAQQQQRKRGRAPSNNQLPATTNATGAAATSNNLSAHTARPPLLNTLRDMVNGPHTSSAIGKGRKEFEAKLLVGAETCHQIMGKIATLAGSQSMKHIRNLRELKELYLHMSYLLTYGVRRLQGLQQQCVEDVRSLGFDNAAEFLLTDVPTNASVPEETNKSGQAEGNPNNDDENDCEIIEQSATVIEVDSDDDEGSQSAQSNQASDSVQLAARFEVVSGAPGNYDFRPIASPLPGDQSGRSNTSDTQSNGANNNGQPQNTEGTALPDGGEVADPTKASEPANATKQPGCENSSAPTEQAPNDSNELVELIELGEANDSGTGGQCTDVGQEGEVQQGVSDGANEMAAAPTVEAVEQEASPSKAIEGLSGSELLEQLDSLMDQGLLDVPKILTADAGISDVSKDAAAELVEISPNEVSELLNNQMLDTAVEKEQNNQTNQQDLEKRDETNESEEMGMKQLETDISKANNESNSVLEQEGVDSSKPTAEAAVVEKDETNALEIGKEASKAEGEDQSAECTAENEKQNISPGKDMEDALKESVGITDIDCAERERQKLESANEDHRMEGDGDALSDKRDIAGEKDSVDSAMAIDSFADVEMQDDSKKDKEEEDKHLEGTTEDIDMKDDSSMMLDKENIVNDLNILGEKTPDASSLSGTISSVDLALASLEDASKDVEMKDQSNSLESKEEIASDSTPAKENKLEEAESHKQVDNDTTNQAQQMENAIAERQLETENCSEEQSTGKEESFSERRSSIEIPETERQDVAKETVDGLSEMSVEDLNDDSMPGGSSIAPSLEHSTTLEADKTVAVSCDTSTKEDDMGMSEAKTTKTDDNVETSSMGSSEGFRSPETILSDSFLFESPCARIRGESATLEERNVNEEASISAGGEASGKQNSENEDMISLESISNDAWEDSEQDGTQDGMA